jgi:hypothetical protein
LLQLAVIETDSSGFEPLMLARMSGFFLSASD